MTKPLPPGYICRNCNVPGALFPVCLPAFHRFVLSCRGFVAGHWKQDCPRNQGPLPSSGGKSYSSAPPAAPAPNYPVGTTFVAVGPGMFAPVTPGMAPPTPAPAPGPTAAYGMPAAGGYMDPATQQYMMQYQQQQYAQQYGQGGAAGYYGAAGGYPGYK